MPQLHPPATEGVSAAVGYLVKGFCPEGSADWSQGQVANIFLRVVYCCNRFGLFSVDSAKFWEFAAQRTSSMPLDAQANGSLSLNLNASISSL